MTLLEDGEPEIVLDLSRLVSRILHATPTGIDRVEMAYAREFNRRIPERLAFGVVHPAGFYGRLPREGVTAFLNATEARWNESGSRPLSKSGSWQSLIPTLARLRPRLVPKAVRPRVFVQSSPHHLDNPGLVRRILHREKARFVCLLHDLIPIEFPEYARPGGAVIHRRRMDTVAHYADGILANSAATLNSFLRYIEPSTCGQTAIAHLGLDLLPRSTMGERRGHPYFVCLGTIEPRKNHLLLLNVWRKLAEQFGAASVPKLIIVGRRGWENEQVVDMLERCPALHDCVEEHAALSDQAVQTLVAGSRALLLPSFAEGYGIPVPEALALGTAVICSDLPALREVGGAVPEYLDPLDGAGWQHAILDYAADPSARRDGQIKRCYAWSPPTWSDHIDTVLEFAARIAA